jgi:hypothetical protein
MDRTPPSDEHEAPPAQRYGLFIAAIAAALLGLTTLDAADTQVARKPHPADAERTAECIVASAMFVGVHPAR